MSKRNILIVTCALLLSNAMSGLDSTIINTALPAIISDLHGLEMMGWIVAVFLLGTAVSTPLWSKLGEHIGNKRSYQLAALFFVVGSLLQGMAPNIVFLIIARTIAGIGNGGVVSLPYIIYARMYTNPRKRMQVLGFVSASYSTATIIGPLVGGFIVDAFTWHWVFYLNVPIGLLSALLVQIYYKKEKTVGQTKPVDYLGSILMTIGLTSLLAGIEMIGSASTLFVVAALVVAVISLGSMVHFEKGVADPIIPIKVQQDIPVATSFSFLIRMLSQTFTAAIFGLVMNNALRQGVTKSGGTITMKMMNKLSDATNIDSLPSHLLPQMRLILHHGLHNIMLLALILMLISLGINIWAQHLEKQAARKTAA